MSFFNFSIYQKISIGEVSPTQMPLTTYCSYYDRYSASLKIPRSTAFYRNKKGEQGCNISKKLKEKNQTSEEGNQIEVKNE